MDNQDRSIAEGWSCYTSTPADSLALFDRLRGVCPVAHSSQHDGFYMLLDWRSVRAAMSDYKSFSSQPQVLRPMLPRKPIPGLEMDPPQHREWRAIYNAAISRIDIGEMTEFIRNSIRRRLAEIENQQECEIISTLCEPIPAETICHLVGIFDIDIIGEIRRAALAMFAAQGDPNLFGKRQDEFAQVTLPQIHARKLKPKDDFLTYLSCLEVEGRQLNDEDYVVLLAAFLGAGHHSTTSAMASSIWEIFSRKDLRDNLRDSPDLIPLAVEEVLRLRPPFFGFFRRTTKDVSISGTEILLGKDVYCGWAAANRDPSVFDKPAELDIGRPNIRHMSFGFGIHSCPGAPLARLEIKVLLEELLSAFPEMEPRDSCPEYAFGGGDYAFIPQLFMRLSARGKRD